MCCGSYAVQYAKSKFYNDVHEIPSYLLIPWESKPELTSKEQICKNIEKYEIELETIQQKYEQKISEQQNKINNEKQKLEYLLETNSENFDLSEFKCYQILKTAERKDLSILEQSKLIAQMLKENENGC